MKHGLGLMRNATDDYLLAFYEKGSLIQRNVQIRYANGEGYCGSLLNEKRHGKGTYYYGNGDTYTGDWVEGKKHG